MTKTKVKVDVGNRIHSQLFASPATIQDQVISYTEEDGTKTQYDLKTNIFYRENKELKMNFPFVEGKETEGTIYMKEMAYTMRINLTTTEIKRRANNVYVKYTIEGENFRVRIEEIKWVYTNLLK